MAGFERHRMYRGPDGAKIPSVTTILNVLDKPALVQWAANSAVNWAIDRLNEEPYVIGDKLALLGLLETARTQWRVVSHAARDIGSEVHEIIERWLTTGQQPAKCTEQAAGAFVAFLRWQEERHLRVIKTEHTVYGQVDGRVAYAGTLDLLAEIDGQTYVIDIKASKGIWREYELQVAAYRAAVTDPPVMGCGILRLDKETGEPEWRDTSSRYERDIGSFRALVRFWHLENERR